MVGGTALKSYNPNTEDGEQYLTQETRFTSALYNNDKPQIAAALRDLRETPSSSSSASTGPVVPLHTNAAPVDSSVFQSLAAFHRHLETRADKEALRPFAEWAIEPLSSPPLPNLHPGLGNSDLSTVDAVHTILQQLHGKLREHLQNSQAMWPRVGHLMPNHSGEAQSIKFQSTSADAPEHFPANGAKDHFIWIARVDAIRAARKSGYAMESLQSLGVLRFQIAAAPYCESLKFLPCVKELPYFGEPVEVLDFMDIRTVKGEIKRDPAKELVEVLVLTFGDAHHFRYAYGALAELAAKSSVGVGHCHDAFRCFLGLDGQRATRELHPDESFEISPEIADFLGPPDSPSRDKWIATSEVLMNCQFHAEQRKVLTKISSPCSVSNLVSERNSSIMFFPFCSDSGFEKNNSVFSLFFLAGSKPKPFLHSWFARK